MNAFCASVNFDAFIRFRSFPSQERLTENSSFKWSSFQQAEHALIGFVAGSVRPLASARSRSATHAERLIIPMARRCGAGAQAVTIRTIGSKMPASAMDIPIGSLPLARLLTHPSLRLSGDACNATMKTIPTSSEKLKI